MFRRFISRGFLKGTQSALNRSGLYTSLFTLTKVHLNLKKKDTRRLYIGIRFNLRSVSLDFQSFTKTSVFECGFAHPMIFYQISA